MYYITFESRDKEKDVAQFAKFEDAVVFSNECELNPDVISFVFGQVFHVYKEEE